MWVSVGFVNEIIEAQATKLSIIDEAFDSVFAPPPVSLSMLAPSSDAAAVPTPA
jgi:hypothetical protein